MAGIGDDTFFIYDCSINKKEADDPKDAIVFFHPNTVSIDLQCMLCGQLIGAVSFTQAFSNSPPQLIRMKRMTVAVKYEGIFVIALAGSVKLPNRAVINRLNALYRLFSLFHDSITRVQQESLNRDLFLCTMKDIWSCYLRFVHRHNNSISSLFESIPVVNIPKNEGSLFLKASHILQSCRQHDGVIAGCILYKNSILCNQLPALLLSSVLILTTNRCHLPIVTVDTDFPLPKGICILSIFLAPEEFNDIYSQMSATKYHVPLPETACHQMQYKEQDTSKCVEQVTSYIRTTDTIPNILISESETSQISCDELTDNDHMQQIKPVSNQIDCHIGVLNGDNDTEFPVGTTSSDQGSQYSEEHCIHLNSDLGKCSHSREILSAENTEDDMASLGSSVVSELCDNNKPALKRDIHQWRSQEQDLIYSDNVAGNISNNVDEASTENVEHVVKDALTIDTKVNCVALENTTKGGFQTHNDATSIDGIKECTVDETSHQLAIDEQFPSHVSNQIPDAETLACTECLSSLHGKEDSYATDELAVEDGKCDCCGQNLAVEDGKCDCCGQNLAMEDGKIQPDLIHKATFSTDQGVVTSLMPNTLIETSCCAENKIQPDLIHKATFSTDQGVVTSLMPNTLIETSCCGENTGTTDQLNDAKMVYEDVSVTMNLIHLRNTGESSDVTGNTIMAEKSEDYTFSSSTDSQTMLTSEDVDSEFTLPTESDTFEKDEVTANITDETPSLKNISLYLQAHSEMALLLIIDNKLRNNAKVINELWITALPQLGDLEAQLNQAVDSPVTSDDTKPYRFIRVDSFDRKLQGVNYIEKSAARLSFYESLQTVTEQFHHDSNISNITLRSSESVIYGHQNSATQTFFQPSTVTWPIKGIPSPRDLDFCLEIRARRKLHRDHDINII